MTCVFSHSITCGKRKIPLISIVSTSIHENTGCVQTKNGGNEWKYRGLRGGDKLGVFAIYGVEVLYHLLDDLSFYLWQYKRYDAPRHVKPG